MSKLMMLMSEASEVVDANDLPFGEKMLFGLQTFAIGLLVVFAILALIILFVSVIRSGIHAVQNRGENTSETTRTQVEPVTASQEPTPVTTADGIPEEEIAAISAAITAYYQTRRIPTAGFIIHSVKRR